MMKRASWRVLAILCTAGAAWGGPAATRINVVRVGTVNAGAIAGGSTSFNDSINDAVRRPDSEINRRIPHTAYSPARVPASHVPNVAGNSIAATNPGFTGAAGLTHLDQRLAGTGSFADTQFSLEPPDQGLCVGGGFVIETVNTAMRIRNTSGSALTGPIALNQFFGLAPEIAGRTTTTPVFGDFTSDPRCYWDRDTRRFYLTLLQADEVPSTGAITGKSSVMIAVSQTSDPTATWNIYRTDTTNDGTHGTPTHSNCPCFGDQPLIGADANGFYISTNEFPWFTAGFNGAQIYAMDKFALAAGTAIQVSSFNTGAIAAPDGGIWYSVQPATIPPGGTFESAAGGTEYFLSALDFNGTLDNRIAVWAVTNSASLRTATPNVSLSLAVIDSQVYGQGPAAEQQDGPRPLGASLKEKLEFLDNNDDRMQQVMFANGRLWSALNTVVKTPNRPAASGIAYFAVSPAVGTAGAVSGSVVTQGYVAVNTQHVIFPSVAVNAAGQGAMVFTLTGNAWFPSAAYVTLDAVNGAGPIHVAGAGTGPEDGFSGYGAFGGNRVARWGDYSAATVDDAGNIWMAAEFIPGSPRTVLANWGTLIGLLVP